MYNLCNALMLTFSQLLGDGYDDPNNILVILLT
jgi:hypothetical protein